MGVAPDPERKEKDDDGQTRAVLVWFPRNLFATEKEWNAAAEEALGDNSDASSGVSLPEGWTPELWAKFEPQMLEAIGDDWGVPNLSKVAKEFGVGDVSYLQALKP